MLTVVLVAVALVAGTQGCCYPDQWEGTEGFISGSADDEGHGAITLGNVAISMDATLPAIYIDETLYVNGQMKNYKILQLYSQNAQYIIEGSKCTRTVLDKWGPEKHCIPVNATLQRQYYFGSSKTLNVAEYAFDVLQQTFVLGVSDECVPVVERTYGDVQGTNILNIAGFFNISKGIKDPSVFKVPAICNTTLPIHKPVYRKRRSFFTSDLL